MDKTVKMNSSEEYVTAINNLITAIKEDKVLNTVIKMVCNTGDKIAEIINKDNYENIMTDYDGETACITINNNYFTDIEQHIIGTFTSDVIEACNNMNKPQYELINIKLFDDVVVLKVKV